MAEWSKALDPVVQVGSPLHVNSAYFASRSFYLHSLKVVPWVETFISQFWLLLVQNEVTPCKQCEDWGPCKKRENLFNYSMVTRNLIELI